MISRFLFLFALGAVVTVALASPPTDSVASSSEPIQTLATTAAAPAVPARAYAVFDAETGVILYEQNADVTLPIASITKLYSAAAVHELFALEATTTVAWADLNSHGTAGNLSPGEVYSYRELLFPLLLSSSNNAALLYELRGEVVGGDIVAAAERIGRDHGALGLQLADASGLSADNQATAKELARSAHSLLDAYPYIFSITRLNSYLGPYHGWTNNSPLIATDGYVGGKHGFTNAAGRTVVAFYEETINDRSATIGYVVLGSDDLLQDVSQLREYVANSVVWQ